MTLSLSNFLMNDKVNRFVAGLDDQSNMNSVFIRDMVDVGGRVSVAARRDPKYELPEVAFEQTLTSIIWCFGIRWCKSAYDATVRKLHQWKLSPIKLPELEDLSLINIQELIKGTQKSTQALTPKIINQYAAPEVKEHLLAILKNENGLKKAYRNSAVIKFVVATVLPCIAIGFGLPTIKNKVTHKRLMERKQQDIHRKQLATLTHTQGFQGITHPKAFTVFGGTNPFKPLGKLESSKITVTPKNTTPQFGFVSGLANSVMRGTTMFLQNEQANTMLVDATISGGRLFKARNWLERLEIFYQESTLIFFAYFALSPLQRFFQGKFDKWLNTQGSLKLPAFKKLLERYKDGNNQWDKAKFKAEWPQIKAQIKEFVDLEYRYKDLPKAQRKAAISKYLDDFEAKWTPLAREYVYQTETLGNTAEKNIVLDLAKANKLIPTMKGEDGKIYNNLVDHKVKTSEIYKIGEALNKMVNDGRLSKTERVFEEAIVKAERLTDKQAEDTLKRMNRFLRKSMASRFGSLFLGMAVCSAFLGIVVPRTKQWMTKKITGKDQFPGTLNGGQRQDFFGSSKAIVDYR